MLSFEEFQEYIKKNLPDMLSTSCPNATVSLTSVTKNNGRELHAVCVRPEGSDIAPTIYLESFYQKYEEGFTLDAVLSDIAEVSMSHMDTPSEFSTIGKDFQNFDFVKDKIIMVAVNAERNMTLLDSAPHQRREDLALIYKVMVGNDREGIATITIKNEHLSFWDKTVEDLHALAMENTKELLPAKILSMDNIMLEMFGGELPEDLAGMEQERPMTEQMFVISNTAKVNGAATIFYPDVLTELSEKMGTDLYILPSSVHECIAVSTNMGTPESLSEMVREVNGTTVSLEEQLSDHVYCFDSKTKTLSIADTTMDEIEKTVESKEFHINRGKSR